MAEEPTIKAIPTKYKGYKFRSRLEARWAVFLDTLGVEYRYEDEGFQLEMPDFDKPGADGIPGVKTVWYLPDFWIPSWGVFLEVKPDREPNDGETERAWTLAMESEKPVLVVCGQPWPGEYNILLFDDEGMPSDRPAEFIECARSDALWVRAKDHDDDWALRLEADRMSTDGRIRFAFVPGIVGRLYKAYQAARSARFDRH